jgi:hypothetical protein
MGTRESTQARRRRALARERSRRYREKRRNAVTQERGGVAYRVCEQCGREGRLEEDFKRCGSGFEYRCLDCRDGGGGKVDTWAQRALLEGAFKEKIESTE